MCIYVCLCAQMKASLGIMLHIMRRTNIGLKIVSEEIEKMGGETIFLKTLVKNFMFKQIDALQNKEAL